MIWGCIIITMKNETQIFLNYYNIMTKITITSQSSIKPGKYKHFKGKFYEVIGIAHHSETFEEFVVYKALFISPEYGKNALWVRPRKMFFERVIVEGREVPRFEYVGE